MTLLLNNPQIHRLKGGKPQKRIQELFEIGNKEKSTMVSEYIWKKEKGGESEITWNKVKRIKV